MGIAIEEKESDDEKSVIDENKKIAASVVRGNEDPLKSQKLTTDFFGNMIKIERPYKILNRPLSGHQRGFDFEITKDDAPKQIKKKP